MLHAIGALPVDLRWRTACATRRISWRRDQVLRAANGTSSILRDVFRHHAAREISTLRLRTSKELHPKDVRRLKELIFAICSYRTCQADQRRFYNVADTPDANSKYHRDLAIPQTLCPQMKALPLLLSEFGYRRNHAH